MLATMHASAALLVLAFAALSLLSTQACDPGQKHNGCKIVESTCTCGYGCSTEYIYSTRRDCQNALRGNLKERSSNVCVRMPCIVGICIQTVQEPGFICKCEGTGFYGQRCEKGFLLAPPPLGPLQKNGEYERDRCTG